jgi:predicted RNase H-like nuclease
VGETVARVLDVRVVRALDEILAFVREHGGQSFTLAIDAPTIIPEGDRMRECERLLHRDETIRRAHAAPYPGTRSRLGRYNGGRPRGEELVERLVDIGVSDVGCPPAFHERKHVIEVFPAAALVRLFNLTAPLPYKRKKGRTWESCRAELANYVDRLRRLTSPGLTLPNDFVVSGQRGRAFKELEDRVDAVTCSYVAALAWLGRAEMLGSQQDGYIVMPTKRSQSS